MTSSSIPPLPDNLPVPLRILAEEVDRCQQKFDTLWPIVLEMRRRYFVDGTAIAKADMEAAVEDSSLAKDELHAAIAALIAESGIDPDDLLDDEGEPSGDPFPAISRASVVESAPAAAAFVEDHLPEAIELIERHAPRDWLEREPADNFRLRTTDDGLPISIVKGVRLESERPKGHRLRQMLTLARDYLANDSRYDHFAGALAVTQLAQLGARAQALSGVAGSEKRLGALFNSSSTDATMLELLVAGACAAKGRDMAFIDASSDKSPDLRCNDAFKMVIECKRSIALSDYEIIEETRMRELFALLHTAGVARGQFGTFEVELTEEATGLNIREVADKCLLQRLAAHPERCHIHGGQSPFGHSHRRSSWRGRPRPTVRPCSPRCSNGTWRCPPGMA